MAKIWQWLSLGLVLALLVNSLCDVNASEDEACLEAIEQDCNLRQAIRAVRRLRRNLSPAYNNRCFEAVKRDCDVEQADRAIAVLRERQPPPRSWGYAKARKWLARQRTNNGPRRA